MGDSLITLAFGGLVLILIVMFVVGLAMLFALPEVNVFNQHYGTHYTAWQWIWASGTIKNYIGEGRVERRKIQLDINQIGGTQ